MPDERLPAACGLQHTQYSMLTDWQQHFLGTLSPQTVPSD